MKTKGRRKAEDRRLVRSREKNSTLSNTMAGRNARRK